MDYESIAHTLNSTGRCVCPGFITPEFTEDLRQDLTRIQNEGKFRLGGVGQGKDLQVRTTVRRDEIHWLNEEDANSIQQVLWDKLNSLKQAFNRTLYLGLTEFEGHYASYPPGGFYKKHLDCFHGDSARMVSLILYLNQNWKPADGGQLRIYKEGAHIDIEPKGGTLVCFLSRELEHEVLLGHATRTSFVGWFKTARHR